MTALFGMYDGLTTSALALPTTCNRRTHTAFTRPDAVGEPDLARDVVGRATLGRRWERLAAGRSAAQDGRKPATRIAEEAQEGPGASLQKLALSGDSTEAIQPTQLQENRPSVSPEPASLCR